MKPLVSIIMGSTSDMPVMQEAAKVLDELEIYFEINALSAHRTPEKVRSEEHTSELQSRRNLVCRLLLEKKKNNICQKCGYI